MTRRKGSLWYRARRAVIYAKPGPPLSLLPSLLLSLSRRNESARRGARALEGEEDSATPQKRTSSRRCRGWGLRPCLFLASGCLRRRGPHWVRVSTERRRRRRRRQGDTRAPTPTTILRYMYIYMYPCPRLSTPSFLPSIHPLLVPLLPRFPRFLSLPSARVVCDAICRCVRKGGGGEDTTRRHDHRRKGGGGEQ